MGSAAVPPATPEAIFFDAGNTLLTMDYSYLADRLNERSDSPAASAPVEPTALGRAEMAARPGLSEFLAENRSTESGFARETYLRLVLSGLGWPESALTGGALADLVEWMGEVEVADRVWAKVDPTTPELLRELLHHGLSLAVVSNSDGEIHRRLDEAGLAELFEVVIDSGRFGVEKPDPAIFRHAAAEVGVPVERCLHVGDIFHVDVVGAQAAGAVGVLLDPLRQGRFNCPEIGALGELTQFLGP